jgi:hypothetical protein
MLHPTACCASMLGCYVCRLHELRVLCSSSCCDVLSVLSLLLSELKEKKIVLVMHGLSS